jgi:hypothetical protein
MLTFSSREYLHEPRRKASWQGRGCTVPELDRVPRGTFQKVHYNCGKPLSVDAAFSSETGIGRRWPHLPTLSSQKKASVTLP